MKHRVNEKQKVFYVKHICKRYIFLGEFDMRVKSCSANTENSRPIQLSDEHGCVLRPKMISKFMKIAGADTRASVVTYAFFHAFKFPDSMAVHIRCKVVCIFITTSESRNHAG